MIIAGGLGLIVGGVIFAVKSKSENNFWSKQAEKKEENKKQILDLMQNKQKITNNEVEQLLKVSDSTATRYLDELEQEQKITQIGITGQSVYYVLK